MNRTKSDRPTPKQIKTINVEVNEYKALCAKYSALLIEYKRLNDIASRHNANLLQALQACGNKDSTIPI